MEDFYCLSEIDKEEISEEFKNIIKCTKCGKEKTSDCFYGRNKVCKSCYNKHTIENYRKKHIKKQWRCKVCGTTDLNLKYFKYLLCCSCAKNQIKVSYPNYKCRVCGDTDEKNKASTTGYICKKCHNLKCSERYFNKRKSNGKTKI